VPSDVVAPRGGGRGHGDGVADLQGGQGRPRRGGDENVTGGTLTAFVVCATSSSSDVVLMVVGLVTPLTSTNS